MLELKIVPNKNGNDRLSSSFNVNGSNFIIYVDPTGKSNEKVEMQLWLNDSSIHPNKIRDKFSNNEAHGIIVQHPNKPRKNYQGIIWKKDISQEFNGNDFNEVVSSLRQNVDNEKKDVLIAIISRMINYSFETLKRDTKYPRNWIVFGAPGTGKSFQLEEDRKDFFTTKDANQEAESTTGSADTTPQTGIPAAPEGLTHGASDDEHDGGDSQSASSESAVEKYWKRVTFYPTYSYSQFVGSYKPVMNEEQREIAYEFVPGPFLELLAEARKEYDGKCENATNYLLIIEEINRANAAAVFGDMFQLLDRNDNGESEYAVATSKDVRKYLAEKWELKKTENGTETWDIDNPKVTSLKLPPNFYIWATMNSADQGVFPLDTAFKRRWEFEYLGVDDNNTTNATIEIKGGTISWDDLRKKINALLTKNNVNEDKLLGPFFVKKDGPISQKTFISKVLMYLWEDAARMCRKKVFNNEIATFSALQKAWNNLKINEGDTVSLSEIFLLDENDAKIEVERSTSWTTDHREQQNESPTNAAPQAGVSTEEETDSSAPSDPAPGES